MSAANISSSSPMAYQASSTTSHTQHILLIFMVSAAFMATSYLLITVSVCLWNQLFRNSQHTSETAQSSMTAVFSVAHMIPAHTYRKKDRGSENEICAVCLGDFEEGEDLRTLPECMHSFHVSCIDMWLYSHSSCPICRADALPSPVVRIVVPRTADSGESDADHSLGMLRSLVVQDRRSRML